MVGFRKDRSPVFALVLALTCLQPACRKGGGGGPDCKPLADEQLAEFVRLQSEGVEFYKKRDTNSAIQKFEAALALNPCDVAIHNDLGIAYHQARKVRPAVDTLKKGAAIDPLYPLTHLNLGIVYDELAQFEDAVKAFGEFLKLSPDFAEAHRRLGNVYYKMTRYDDARREMERAVQLKPDDWDAWYALGSIAFHAKDYAKAAEYFAKTIELNGSYTEALYKHATTLQRLGRDAEAEVFLARFKKLSVHQERIDEIQRLLSSASDRKHELYTALALETAKVGLPDDAMKNFQQALAIKPDHAQALAGLAELHRERKEFDRALELALQAKSIDPTFTPAYDTIMKVHEEQGDQDQVIAVVRELIEKNPSYLDAWLNLGLLEHRRGRFAEAIEALQKYAAERPDDRLPQEILLAIFTEAGDPKFQDKKKALELALKLEPLGSTQYEFLAEAHHMNGDRKRAIALLKKGLEDPAHPQAAIMREHLAKIEKEGRTN